MINYFGDFPEDATVYIPFNTFDSNDPSASVTITNLADADIMVHKNGGTTQIATDGATVAIDYDGITGNHLITIDTSVHADYSTGAEYHVRIEGTTVDAATINAWVGCFSIERAGGVLALLKGANGLSNIKTDTAAILVDTAEIGTAGAGLTNLGGSGNNWNVGKTGYSLTATTGLGNQTANITGTLSGTVGGIAGTITTLDALDTAQDTQHSTTQGLVTTVDTVVDAILVDTGTTIPGVLGTPAGADLATDIANVKTDTAAVLIDTNELQGDWANGGRLDLLIDGIKAKTDSLTYTVAGQVDANVQSVNDVTIVGDGSGTPFNV